jgi:hypothetical protein
MPVMNVDTSKAQNLGEGIQAVEVDGKLVLIIDPAKDFGVSTSGKMRACANSGGFTSAPFGLKLNLYAGRKI